MVDACAVKNTHVEMALQKHVCRKLMSNTDSKSRPVTTRQLAAGARQWVQRGRTIAVRQNAAALPSENHILIPTIARTEAGG